jgi:hypothetical protein
MPQITVSKTITANRREIAAPGRAGVWPYAVADPWQGTGAKDSASASLTALRTSGASASCRAMRKGITYRLAMS